MIKKWNQFNESKAEKPSKNSLSILKEAYDVDVDSYGSQKFLKIDKIVDGEFVDTHSINISSDSSVDYLYFVIKEGREDCERLYNDWKRQQRQAQEEIYINQEVENINRVENEY